MKNMPEGKDIEDFVQIQFKADLSESFYPTDNGHGWGFSIMRDERSAYVEIGNRKNVEKYFDQCEDNLLALALFFLLKTTDEIASELLDEIRDGEEGVVVNKEYFSNKKVQEAIGLLGEDECERMDSVFVEKVFSEKE